MATHDLPDVRHDCNCCGYFTLHRDPRAVAGSPAPCPVCHWTFDERQRHNPGDAGPPNGISLRAARMNFRRFGAAHQAALTLVRPATRDEMHQPW